MLTGDSPSGTAYTACIATPSSPGAEFAPAPHTKPVTFDRAVFSETARVRRTCADRSEAAGGASAWRVEMFPQQLAVRSSRSAQVCIRRRTIRCGPGGRVDLPIEVVAPAGDRVDPHGSRTSASRLRRFRLNLPSGASVRPSWRAPQQATVWSSRIPHE